MNCYGGSWAAWTYSFYNESGCFTIHFLSQRGELDCYCAAAFSAVREELCHRSVDMCSIKPEIWEKNQNWYLEMAIFPVSAERIYACVCGSIKGASI